MTATIKGSYTKRKVLKSWNLSHGLFYRLQLDASKMRTLTNPHVIYRAEQLTVHNNLQCRKRTHAAYKRKPIVRGRIAL